MIVLIVVSVAVNLLLSAMFLVERSERKYWRERTRYWTAETFEQLRYNIARTRKS